MQTSLPRIKVPLEARNIRTGVPRNIRAGLPWLTTPQGRSVDRTRQRKGSQLASRQRCALHAFYRGTSLIRKRPPLGPFRRPLPRVLGGSKGGGRFLMGEMPLYHKTCCFIKFPRDLPLSGVDGPPPCVPPGRDTRQEDVEKPFDSSTRRVTYPESYITKYTTYTKKNGGWSRCSRMSLSSAT